MKHQIHNYKKTIVSGHRNVLFPGPCAGHTVGSPRQRPCEGHRLRDPSAADGLPSQNELTRRNNWYYCKGNCKGDVHFPCYNESNFFCVCFSRLCNRKQKAITEAPALKCVHQHVEAVRYDLPPSPATNAPLIEPHGHGAWLYFTDSKVSPNSHPFHVYNHEFATLPRTFPNKPLNLCPILLSIILFYE